MTLKDAINAARIESRNGYVQHVNRHTPITSHDGTEPDVEYVVSDWYNSNTTVASFEGGLEISRRSES